MRCCAAIANIQKRWPCLTCCFSGIMWRCMTKTEFVKEHSQGSKASWAKPSEVARLAQDQGIDITPSYVSQIRYQMNKAGEKAPKNSEVSIGQPRQMRTVSARSLIDEIEQLEREEVELQRRREELVARAQSEYSRIESFVKYDN